jgi:pyruvate/2-oxoglutarate/acetoin dehydrogenase E1 component
MPDNERVAENLNRGLAELLAGDDRVCLLGEDVTDPYGGAFGISRGLSTRFPGRVLSTPISEGAIMGVAGGLALCGERPIVEIMFGDFITLCFDQLYNFATKSVAMYGTTRPMPIIVRCPVGGGRGYGPTHSQSPQKHFVGIPHLTLFELSPFHDSGRLLESMMDTGEPAILFEDKTLYARRTYRQGRVSDLMDYDFVDGGDRLARAFVADQDRCHALVIAPGGVADHALTAAHGLFLDHEIACQVVVPAQLYPFDAAPLEPLVLGADVVCVLEEGAAGGTWGREVAGLIHDRWWDKLRRPVLGISSAPAVIPAATHLERDVLVGPSAVRDAIREAVHG